MAGLLLKFSGVVPGDALRGLRSGVCMLKKGSALISKELGPQVGWQKGKKHSVNFTTLINSHDDSKISNLKRFYSYLDKSAAAGTFNSVVRSVCEASFT